MSTQGDEAFAASEQDEIFQDRMMYLELISRPVKSNAEAKEKKRFFKRQFMKGCYDKAKTAKVGETVTCAGCKTQFVKKHYQQAFCQTKCKDKYWNFINDKRLNRAQRYQQVAKTTTRTRTRNDS